jgi:hypothetical protein
MNQQIITWDKNIDACPAKTVVLMKFADNSILTGVKCSLGMYWVGDMTVPKPIAYALLGLTKEERKIEKLAFSWSAFNNR